VSRRVLRAEIPVYPERMMFRVHDPACDLEAPGGPLLPVEALISAGRDQLIVACAQDYLGVQLTIEEWDDAPPPFSDGYEDEAKCVLYLRGKLTVDMGSQGRAIDALRLTGGVGDYGVRVYTRNRKAALRSYEELFRGADADPLSDEFQQARKQLEGLEQYLLQLWRES
jgi:hypothetical protein